MKCLLCLQNEANVKNTHYLTDGIIRSSQNFDGSSGNKNREKGLTGLVTGDSPFIEFSFQRSTPTDYLEEQLGRPVTDEEIGKAKKNSFAVDDFFCSECESIFSAIENVFSHKMLGLFRDKDISNIDKIVLKDEKYARLFFILQVWRTSACDDKVKIDDVVKESLRKVILNYKDVSLETLRSFPLMIKYAQTVGEQIENTTNPVGIIGFNNPVAIWMNDFVIQFFNSFKDISFFDFFGLNEKETYTGLFDPNSEGLIVEIIKQERRRKIIRDLLMNEMYKKIIWIGSIFAHRFFDKYRFFPSLEMIGEFTQKITEGDFDLQKYTENKVVEAIDTYLSQLRSL